ncbi:tudor and KH domain-containing protein-like isoform X2 [Mesocricetus auratus]|uniref:Tudor and KH domain-containing protein-like isoform X2 n=1 Tax=Mesocricetus auratus TaxID=10036 RepID=A0ABM2Y615_MESAU|nr:tudor and KH domain-containing protein-like isoform X2 [Mesocricetus auratus]XP_040610308.1 tudor and KH domain-containing protein-like isoform X2 [Mesocricetus auratus]
MATEQISQTNLSTMDKIALGLGIPAGVTVAYILYRRYRESRAEQLTHVGKDDVHMEMRVPQEAVRLIIGRQGANIKRLRKQTGARIDLDLDLDDEGDERVVLLSGSPVEVDPWAESLGEVARRFVLSVRLLEPKLRAIKNQRGRYYCQDS